MAIITQITLPSGNTYDITDAGARALIQELMNYTAYLGVTTTELVDGVTTSPVISINGESVTAVAGNVATYETEEFIYASTGVWQKFAELSGLGALAHKDSASGSYTPSGTVSQPTFSGNSLTSTGNFTPEGSISQPTFSGSAMTSTGNFTPEGSCSGADVELNTTTVNSITDVGTLPSATMPTVSIDNETLIFTAGSFNAGTLPTKGSDTTVATTVKSVTQPTFSGTQGSISVSGTPTGTVSQPTFSGTQGSVSVSGIPSGTVSQPTFSGTSGTITVS